jgi:toxin ParE1/3/4
VHKIEWSLPAIGDLRSAAQYIAEDNVAAAMKMADLVQDAVEYLAAHPNIGRVGRLGGTRELIVSGTPFVVVYWVREGDIQILRVLHHAKRWP